MMNSIGAYGPYLPIPTTYHEIRDQLVSKEM